jgi:Protein of unknown function (DUF429)
MFTPQTPRVIAVDWSGAETRVRNKLWLAECTGSTLTRLENGRSREELIEHLIELKRENPHFVVALDFAFSFPQWFLEINGLTSAAQLWSLAAFKAEQWLKECPTPFWGRNGVKKPPIEHHFRWTEASVEAVGGVRPKSVFQVYGAGAVGTGTVRGMPFLKRLREAGFSIWPFDPPAWPLVVEIYPRLLTGQVKKSRPQERSRYLKDLAGIPPELRKKAADSDDAFDAAVSALVLAQEWFALTKLAQTTDPVLQLEGVIWYPGYQGMLG